MLYESYKLIKKQQKKIGLELKVSLPFILNYIFGSRDSRYKTFRFNNSTLLSLDSVLHPH